jgi:hypothetical protein
MQPSVVRGVELQKFRKILGSNVVISEKTILTQGYQLPLNAFPLYGVSGFYRFPYS